MSGSAPHSYRGGCLCGAVRYEARGEPSAQGYCCCGDCRRASGSGFIPFMNFPAAQVQISGETQLSVARAIRGTDAVRNRCVRCGSLVFGGIVGQARAHTIYAGSLDEAARFRPQMVIFVRDKPEWVVLPPGLKSFATLPGM